jgi:hypothetical protein
MSGDDIKVVQELLRPVSCRVTLDLDPGGYRTEASSANKIAGIVRGREAQQMHRPHRHSRYT